MSDKDVPPIERRRKSGNFFTSLPFLFALGALLFSISFLVSSLPVGSGKLTGNGIQKVYFTGDIDLAHAEIIDRFNQIHAGSIEVIPIHLPFTKFNTNQRKELIARNLRSHSSRIDVFSVDLIWVPRFVKWAEPLAPYFSHAYLDRIMPAALQTCYVDGMLYAMPLFIDIGGMYYRHDLIRALPDGQAIEERIRQSISWTELLDIGRKYFSDRPVYMLQGEAYEGIVVNFNEFYGRPLQDPVSGDMVNFTDPQLISRVDFMRDLIHKHRVTPFESTQFTEDECIRYALQFDVPFVRGWPSLNNERERRFDLEQFRKFSVAPLPHFEGEEPSPLYGGWNMMLSKHSPVKEAAISFMKFAASMEGQLVFYESEGLLPIQHSLYTQGPDSSKTERLEFMQNLMDDGLHRPALAGYTRISDILSAQLHRVLTGELSSELAMLEAQAEIELLMNGGE